MKQDVVVLQYDCERYQMQRGRSRSSTVVRSTSFTGRPNDESGLIKVVGLVGLPGIMAMLKDMCKFHYSDSQIHAAKNGRLEA